MKQQAILDENYLSSSSSSSVKDFIELLKPRVMSLVIFSYIAGLIVAPGEIHPFIAIISILFVSIGSGGAASLNMWYDRDIDAIMSRTKLRPIVRGSIDPQEALAYGIGLSVFSVAGMAVFVNMISALILAISILFYVIIYTMFLKRRTIQNIVIGGAAGAFPPMIGYAAVSGAVTFDSFLLFLLIFMWTPPHFWALALYKSDDYKLANIPMMPVIMGNNYTKKQIFIYTILTSIVSILPYFTLLAGKFYLFSACFLNGIFIFLSWKLLKEKGVKNAPPLFGYSIIYLFAIFSALMLDKLL